MNFNRFRDGEPFGVGVQFERRRRSIADEVAELLSDGGRIAAAAIQPAGTAHRRRRHQPAPRRRPRNHVATPPALSTHQGPIHQFFFPSHHHSYEFIFLIHNQEILSRFVDVERTVTQCVVVPKNPDLAFMEPRINAVVALKHILTLVPPLHHILTKSSSSLLNTLANVICTLPTVLANPQGRGGARGRRGNLHNSRKSISIEFLEIGRIARGGGGVGGG